MNPLAKSKTFLFIIIILIVAIFLQHLTLLSGDVSWLMHCTNKFMHGGKYYYNFLETNPPLILYLYIPPVLLAHALGLSFIISLRFYCFSLAILSTCSCHYLLKKILVPSQIITLALITLTIFLTFVILPQTTIFGQREHLTLMLTTPYILLVVLRAIKINDKNSALSPSVALTIALGIIGGIGFAIKPHFLVPLFFIEFYLAIITKRQQKSFFLSFIRTETIALAATIILYLISIFIFAPEYIFKILPFLQIAYFTNYLRNGWLKIITIDYSIFYLCVIVIYLLLRKHLINKILNDIIALTATGFYISYLLQQTNWPYHAFICAAFAIILLILILAGLKNRRMQIFLAFVAAGLLYFPINSSSYLFSYYTNVRQSPGFAKLIKITKHNAYNKKVFSLNTNTIPFYPLPDYANIHQVSRFEFFWFLSKVIYEPNTKASKKIKTFFFNSIIHDLKKYKPSIIMYDNLYCKNFLCKDAFNIHQLNYIPYLSQDKRFKKIWSHYHFIGEIYITKNHVRDFDIRVYKRDRLYS